MVAMLEQATEAFCRFDEAGSKRARSTSPDSEQDTPKMASASLDGRSVSETTLATPGKVQKRKESEKMEEDGSGRSKFPSIPLANDSTASSLFFQQASSPISAGPSARRQPRPWSDAFLSPAASPLDPRTNVPMSPIALGAASAMASSMSPLQIRASSFQARMNAIVATSSSASSSDASSPPCETQPQVPASKTTPRNISPPRNIVVIDDSPSPPNVSPVQPRTEKQTSQPLPPQPPQHQPWKVHKPTKWIPLPLPPIKDESPSPIRNEGIQNTPVEPPRAISLSPPPPITEHAPDHATPPPAQPKETPKMASSPPISVPDAPISVYDVSESPTPPSKPISMHDAPISVDDAPLAVQDMSVVHDATQEADTPMMDVPEAPKSPQQLQEQASAEAVPAMAASSRHSSPDASPKLATPPPPPSSPPQHASPSPAPPQQQHASPSPSPPPQHASPSPVDAQIVSSERHPSPRSSPHEPSVQSTQVAGQDDHDTDEEKPKEDQDTIMKDRSPSSASPDIEKETLDQKKRVSASPSPVHATSPSPEPSSAHSTPSTHLEHPAASVHSIHSADSAHLIHSAVSAHDQSDDEMPDAPPSDHAASNATPEQPPSLEKEKEDEIVRANALDDASSMKPAPPQEQEYTGQPSTQPLPPLDRLALQENDMDDMFSIGGGDDEDEDDAMTHDHHVHDMQPPQDVDNDDNDDASEHQEQGENDEVDENGEGGSAADSKDDNLDASWTEDEHARIDQAEEALLGEKDMDLASMLRTLPLNPSETQMRSAIESLVDRTLADLQVRSIGNADGTAITEIGAVANGVKKSIAKFARRHAADKQAVQTANIFGEHVNKVLQDQVTKYNRYRHLRLIQRKIRRHATHAAQDALAARKQVDDTREQVVYKTHLMKRYTSKSQENQDLVNYLTALRETAVHVQSEKSLKDE
ncbi:hypothetical protein BC940DRAFT_317322 [Gongronella butleri]|nr:hypothetical protein BC940DRAFT_317322 [Gongronella butleri]